MSRNVERYQWMRNAQGGQQFGYRWEVRPLDRAAFRRYMAPLLGKQVPDLATLRSLVPNVTHYVVVGRFGDWGITMPLAGTPADLRPRGLAGELWARPVARFNDPEALRWGCRSDTDRHPPSPPDPPSGSSAGPRVEVERWQYLRSWDEGFGAQIELRPLDAQTFSSFVQPYLPRAWRLDLATYRRIFPSHTHVRLVRPDAADPDSTTAGWGPCVPIAGALAEVRPGGVAGRLWARRVQSFDGLAALRWGRARLPTSDNGLGVDLSRLWNTFHHRHGGGADGR